MPTTLTYFLGAVGFVAVCLIFAAVMLKDGKVER
jgi:hypothetical protein